MNLSTETTLCSDSRFPVKLVRLYSSQHLCFLLFILCLWPFGKAVFHMNSISMIPNKLYVFRNMFHISYYMTFVIFDADFTYWIPNCCFKSYFTFWIRILYVRKRFHVVLDVNFCLKTFRYWMPSCYSSCSHMVDVKCCCFFTYWCQTYLLALVSRYCLKRKLCVSFSNLL